MRILIATDAWSPQVNGVVRTLNALTSELRRNGHEVIALTPEGRKNLPLPFYTEIGLTQVTAQQIGFEIDVACPDAIHIVTEGPIGWAARRACLRRGLPFTTAFHTKFAEYAAARLPLPGVRQLGWSILNSNYPLVAFLTTGFVAGLVYWLFSGRLAGHHLLSAHGRHGLGGHHHHGDGHNHNHNHASTTTVRSKS